MALSSTQSQEHAELALAPGSVSVVLLSGGTGKRMGASIPKQYLPILGKPICTYSFETFLGMPEVAEVVVVCDDSWRCVVATVARRLDSGAGNTVWPHLSNFVRSCLVPQPLLVGTYLKRHTRTPRRRHLCCLQSLAESDRTRCIAGFRCAGFLVTCCFNVCVAGTGLD